jgi:hypothetical protein
MGSLCGFRLKEGEIRPPPRSRALRVRETEWRTVNPSPTSIAGRGAGETRWGTLAALPTGQWHAAGETRWGTLAALPTGQWHAAGETRWGTLLLPRRPYRDCVQVGRTLTTR